MTDLFNSLPIEVQEFALKDRKMISDANAKLKKEARQENIIFILLGISFLSALWYFIK